MARIDTTLPLIPLSSAAEMLGIKSRTLRMYEDRGLLPRHEGVTKKLYSLDDIHTIELVHYLANVRKINANGIRYLLELLGEMPKDLRAKMYKSAEESLGEINTNAFQEIPETL